MRTIQTNLDIFTSFGIRKGWYLIEFVTKSNLLGLYCPVTGSQNYRYYLVLLLNGVLLYRGLSVINFWYVKWVDYDTADFQNENSLGMS